jgi:HTH-type transcriptional regulator / antitoxin HigA
MNAQVALKTAYQAFANVAKPYLYLRNEQHYHEALELVENLLAESTDTPDDPNNALIDLLSKAIADYESRDTALAEFERAVQNEPADVAMLRLLMDQHGLNTTDFPEIGDKTLLSRILRGERNLTKQHIEKLAARFGISAGLFF